MPSTDKTLGSAQERSGPRQLASAGECFFSDSARPDPSDTSRRPVALSPHRSHDKPDIDVRACGAKRPPHRRDRVRRDAAAPDRAHWDGSDRSPETCSGSTTSISGLTPTSLGESPGGIAPPGARRTGREPLSSSGSHRPTVGARAEPPVGEQARFPSKDGSQEPACLGGVAAQPLVLPSGPTNEVFVDPSE